MLYVITSYFNPCRYRRRFETYREFREHLNIPLVTAELGFGGRFDLRPGDAEILLQFDDGDVMFQKERLLNIAIRNLPADCTAVAWIDCDILFDDPRWGEMTLDKLRTAHVVQPFGSLYRLQQSDPVDFTRSRRAIDPDNSLIKHLFTGQLDSEHWKVTEGSKLPFRGGIAWAARRDLIERVGLYDACILGSGDKAFACALLDIPTTSTEYHHMSPEYERHYRRWMARLHADFPLKLDWVETEALQLWHGDYAHRRYQARHIGFAKYRYAPDRDLVAAPSGSWQWRDPHSEMARYVREYFHSRQEDGIDPLAEAIAA